MNKIKSNLMTIFFFTLVLMFFAATNTYALREIKNSTDEMAKTSTDIVVASCVKSEVSKDEDTGLIFTYTTFKVNESLKGEYPDELVLRIVGGTVGDMTMSVPNTPTFNPDEEVVLFLGPTNSKGYPVLKSLQEGVYKVNTDEAGAKYITMPLRGQESGSDDPHGKTTDGNKVYLDDFINNISQSM